MLKLSLISITLLISKLIIAEGIFHVEFPDTFKHDFPEQYIVYTAQLIKQGELDTALSLIENIQAFVAESRNENLMALKFQLLYNDLNDSFFNSEKIIQFAELEAHYELIEKENEINLLKNEKLQQEMKLEKTKLQRLIIFISFIFLALITIFVWMVADRKQQANKLLKEKNSEIEKQNTQLRYLNQKVQRINHHLNLSRQQLRKANNAKNRFLSILAHDLRNPFHSIIGQSYLLTKNNEALNENEKIEFARQIYDSCVQINKLLDNLLEWGQTQFKGKHYNPVQFKVSDTVHKTLMLLDENASKKNITIENKLDPALTLNGDEAMIETIFRNIINNGIKYTHEGGKVVISALQNTHYVRFIIEDNGVGISKQQYKKLFSIDSNLKTKGTRGEQGTGLGLVICREFVDLHKGKIWAESKTGKGSRFYFELPVS